MIQDIKNMGEQCWDLKPAVDLVPAGRLRQGHCSYHLLSSPSWWWGEWPWWWWWMSHWKEWLRGRVEDCDVERHLSKSRRRRWRRRRRDWPTVGTTAWLAHRLAHCRFSSSLSNQHDNNVAVVDHDGHWTLDKLTINWTLKLMFYLADWLTDSWLPGKNVNFKKQIRSLSFEIQRTNF